MIFNNVNADAWVDAIIGALLINPLNCDDVVWGDHKRPVCIRRGQQVLGDQEVIGVVVSATYSLHMLPEYAHMHVQAKFNNDKIPNNTVALHYKNRQNALEVVLKRLKNFT